MKKVAILIPTLSGRDAVGTDALEMMQVLRNHGHDAMIFADNAIDVDCEIRKPKTLLDYLRSPQDILLYHYSIGWPTATQLLQTVRARRVIKYHNITPPEFFTDYSTEYHHACKAGRATISEIVALNCELYLADSSYNLEELIDHGLNPQRGSVVPPFNRLEGLLDAPADLAFLDKYNKDATNLVMIGRLAPNKGHPALLDAFACYRREFDSNARLLIIGKQDPRLSRYLTRVQERIAHHNLSSAVVLIDNASESQLKAAYLCSDAFSILSEHEGFCVPLIEAMALKVPIVAYGSSAIPGTVGDAGLVWDSNDPLLFACAFDRVRRDQQTRSMLQRNGHQRYQSHFTQAAIAKTFLKALETLN